MALLALGQKVTLNTNDYSGSLQPIAEQLAKESGQLAADLRKSESTRNCQDVVLQIMQLAMMNHEVIEIFCDYNSDCNMFHVCAENKGELRANDYKSAQKLLTERVYFNSFSENPLITLLEIEDKLLELIADAKDKAEVAA